MKDHPLRCPNCGQCAYVVAPPPAEIARAIGAICHCCGFVLDDKALAECRARAEIEDRSRRLR
jgi:hypothetical protein